MIPTTIAIIGAGFSGALTAVNLLRQSEGRALRVILVNRSGRMARGVAYGTSSTEHLLNVPAGNMSALADDADDFLRYCRWANPVVTSASFVRRRQYGGYLEALLEAAEFGAPPAAMLERWVGEAVDLEQPEDGGRCLVRLADGRQIDADHVVLAFGHFPPDDPPLTSGGFSLGARYARDPWATDALEGIDKDEPVLLIGSGLTASDVALALTGRGHRAQVFCLSRRAVAGRAPRAPWSLGRRGVTGAARRDGHNSAHRAACAARGRASA
jgi:uncharacterized NAD(P)/FAD-binding protein YdhS